MGMLERVWTAATSVITAPSGSLREGLGAGGAQTAHTDVGSVRKMLTARWHRSHPVKKHSKELTHSLCRNHSHKPRCPHSPMPELPA